MLTRSEVTYALAESMRDFGYPDFTDEMAGEVMDAYAADPKGKLPHGVVGMMLKSQLDKFAESGADFAALKK